MLGWLSLREGLDTDDSREAPEICSVEREQTTNAMLSHRRDDVSVVHLTAAAAMGGEEIEEAVEHTRSFFGNIEAARKFRTSAIAVAIAKPGAVAWGRVTAARYSRSTCGLTHRAEPSPSKRVSAARAAACCVAEGRVAYTRTFVSTKTGSAAIVAVHVLASEGDAAVPRHVMSRQVGDAGPLFSALGPGDGDRDLVLAWRYGGGGGAGDTMVGSDPNAGANVGHDCSEISHQ